MRFLMKMQALACGKMGLGLLVALIFALPMTSYNLYAAQPTNPNQPNQGHRTHAHGVGPETFTYVARIRAGGTFKEVRYNLTLLPPTADQSDTFVRLAIGSQIVYVGSIRSFKNLIDSYLFYGVGRGRGFGVNLVALARLANLVDSHFPSLSFRVRNAIVNRLP